MDNENNQENHFCKVPQRNGDSLSTSTTNSNENKCRSRSNSKRIENPKDADTFSLNTPVSDKEIMFEVFEKLRSKEGVYTQMQLKRNKTEMDQNGQESLEFKSKRNVPNTHRFSILTFNDVYELMASHDGQGGLANMHTLMELEINKIEKEGIAWISTLNGDFLSASLLAPKFQGKQMIDVLNTMPLTHISIGNHEFDFNTPTETSDVVLLQRIRESNSRWMNSNIFMHGKLFPDTVNKEIITLQNEDGQEVRIGLFALCTGATKILSFPPDFVQFENPVSVAKQMVKILKEEDCCDLIIALTHLPIAQDILLATEAPGIDIILGGHDHMPFTQQQGSTTIVKCGQNAKYLGRVDLYMNKQIIELHGESITTFSCLPEWKLIGNFGYEPHPRTKVVVDNYISYLPSDWDEFLGICALPLDSTTSLCRSTETTMCSLLADSLKDHYKSDLALINGGTCRGDRVYNKGYKLTKGDMYVEFPFESYPRYGIVTGAQLIGSIEDGLKNIGVGGFPHVSHGLNITYDPLGPPGARIVAICFHGKEIDLDREYTIVSTDWLFMGGDGYKHLTKGKLIPHEEDKYFLREHAIRWIKDQKLISVKLEDRLAKL